MHSHPPPLAHCSLRAGAGRGRRGKEEPPWGSYQAAIEAQELEAAKEKEREARMGQSSMTRRSFSRGSIRSMRTSRFSGGSSETLGSMRSFEKEKTLTFGGGVGSPKASPKEPLPPSVMTPLPPEGATESHGGAGDGGSPSDPKRPRSSKATGASRLVSFKTAGDSLSEAA